MNPIRNFTLLATLAAVPAFAAGCTAEALAALSVPNMSIQSAAIVPAAAPVPAYCRVAGAVTTTGESAPNGSARFEVRLPAGWNGKFLFYGVGGLAGSIPAQFDGEGALPKGYAIAITDGGHQAAGTDARWALTGSGQPDIAKLIDYYYRAAHAVTVAARQLVAGYYGDRVQRAYFGGCSNGGRMALMEAQRYPDDYDGIIAGAPFMDLHVLLTSFKVKNSPPGFHLPPTILPAIDQAVYATCDAADGVKDGLIQNPARCAFNPESLLCKEGFSPARPLAHKGTPGGFEGATERCLTPAQVDYVKRYLLPVRDTRGRLSTPGMPLTDFGGPGGLAAWTTGATAPDLTKPELWTAQAPLGWLFSSNIVKYIVQRDPAFPALSFDVSGAGVVGDRALKLFDERTSAANASGPAKLRAFIQKDKKLLMYHGFSDPALTPYRTMMYYEQLAGLTRNSYSGLQKNVRLFMVPGMQHCGGGPGPNVFDSLTALDNWVTKGVAPDELLATRYITGRSGTVARTMPLCKFPEQAKYKGSGDVNDAANWSCAASPGLLESGPAGRAAGWK